MVAALKEYFHHNYCVMNSLFSVLTCLHLAGIVLLLVMSIHLWTCTPTKIRCSEIAFHEAILGQKQDCNMAHEVLHPIISSIYAFAKPADIKLPRKKAVQLAEQQVGFLFRMG